MNISEITKKAKIASGGNIKLGNMGTFSKLMGNETYYIPKLDAMVKGSCGHYCNGCKHDCYVKKSYRHSSVKYGHSLRSLAVRFNLDGLKASLSEQLKRKRKPFDFIRINQSGEIESRDELDMWVTLANEQPETHFYLYTKAFGIVIPYLLEHEHDLPENITVLISVWHESGIDEYNAVKHIPNVKAFVYLDGFSYENFGLNLQTKCNAYVGKKLNHEITCDRCRKCMDRCGNHKEIGCDAH